MLNLKCKIIDLDVKGNFPDMYRDSKCPFKLCTSYESQYHMANCTFYPVNTLIPNGLQYEDIFKSDIQKQFQVMKILMSRNEIRNKMLETQHCQQGGPVDPGRVGASQQVHPSENQ